MCVVFLFFIFNVYFCTTFIMNIKGPQAQRLLVLNTLQRTYPFQFWVIWCAISSIFVLKMTWAQIRVAIILSSSQKSKPRRAVWCIFVPTPTCGWLCAMWLISISLFTSVCLLPTHGRGLLGESARIRIELACVLWSMLTRCYCAGEQLFVRWHIVAQKSN